jgi:hypothetical protein
MNIRSYQTGDDVAQVSIYNDAASRLPKFKPATIDELRRRMRGETDATTRIFAEVDARPVGYLTYHSNGRIGYPWCRAGHEVYGVALLNHALDAMKALGLKSAFAAYRGDWQPVREFFLGQQFTQTREILNFGVDLVEMPTPAARGGAGIDELKKSDLPRVLEMGKGILRVHTVEALEQEFFNNPHYPPHSLFALRSNADKQVLAVGILIADEAYANPKQVDSAMPCFRLGAFGSETMNTKRINGLFSFIAAPGRDVTHYGLDLLSYATNRTQQTEIETFVAQVPSDAEHLVRFYKSQFRRQGAFPLFEKNL